ncbi:hypothetical protein CROQUDRAFT_724690 [Cronartium quercuum f. sp. fusiforme G11]|uniref:LIM zinc-binding domain-containing protein n=1 Tax=Cronartium quercuum f. sp. fusiforme G11 TaxID=708437 RepID=A0A9P6NFU7_9BASI|nr:hypothetical protein CROQUDRAFT_724690 [Cronartium quercuum f. sp. fusiforme G11]
MTTPLLRRLAGGHLIEETEQQQQQQSPSIPSSSSSQSNISFNPTYSSSTQFHQIPSSHFAPEFHHYQPNSIPQHQPPPYQTYSQHVEQAFRAHDDHHQQTDPNSSFQNHLSSSSVAPTTTRSQPLYSSPNQFPIPPRQNFRRPYQLPSPQPPLPDPSTPSLSYYSPGPTRVGSIKRPLPPVPPLQEPSLRSRPTPLPQPHPHFQQYPPFDRLLPHSSPHPPPQVSATLRTVPHQFSSRLPLQHLPTTTNGTAQDNFNRATNDRYNTTCPTANSSSDVWPSQTVVSLITFDPHQSSLPPKTQSHIASKRGLPSVPSPRKPLNRTPGAISNVEPQESPAVPVAADRLHRIEFQTIQGARQQVHSNKQELAAADVPQTPVSTPNPPSIAPAPVSKPLPAPPGDRKPTQLPQSSIVLNEPIKPTTALPLSLSILESVVPPSSPPPRPASDDITIPVSPPPIDSSVPVLNIIGADEETDEEQDKITNSTVAPLGVIVTPPPLIISTPDIEPLSELDHDQEDVRSQPLRTHTSAKISSPPDPNAPSSLFCAGCQQIIAGRVVNALNKRWHPDCFTCEHCGLALEHVAFYEHEGKAYCGVDYDEFFSLKCHHCNTSITDESYVTLDEPSLPDGPRHYHQLHLFCAECGDPFVNPKSLEERSKISKNPNLRSTIQDQDHQIKSIEPNPFVLHRGYPYCEKCHIRLHKPKCWSCKQPMTGDIITAIGKQWHEHCFKCKDCSNPFLNGLFFLQDRDPFCEQCYSIKMREKF